jgi:enolase
MLFHLGTFLRAPYGTARGIKREGLNYYPDAPYNLAVAAAGPRASRNLALVALPPAGILLAVGLTLDLLPIVHVGRLLLGLGTVGLLDFLLADPGKYKEFNERESRAAERAASVGEQGTWIERASAVRKRMLEGRVQEITHPRLGPVTAPWQYRNCGMGGRHTEKEYPESNVSMQEAMFLILGAPDYQECQEITYRLQTRLKEIIEKAEGCRVIGIGLEGGLAPFIEKGSFPLPEVRLWTMMKQTIQECGLRPGTDVAIALDPAMAELEKAYRDEFNMPDSVGMYLFWRDKAKAVLDRDGVLEIYRRAITEYDVPIASIEDGFSEDDHEGWRMLLEALGDRIFVIGDDLVTTNDRTIEEDAGKGLINTALIKANQIGSLYETLIAMLVALGKNLEIVVSHRSKSPNDDMEAHIALAVNALGLKAGGGANTERLVKYQAVAEIMSKGAAAEEPSALAEGQRAVFQRLTAYEEPTNAGVPTVGATVEIALPGSGVTLRFRGATPLGTSAGTGEAIHLVDSRVEQAEHRELIQRYGELFREMEPGVSSFREEVREGQIQESGDDSLQALFARAQRYGGKGCLNAVENVLEIIAPVIEGRGAVSMTLQDVDRILLGLEERVARRRGKIGDDATAEERVHVMQRKQNLGMNALLAVSLALARGLACLKGQELYELLREEMIAIVARLCEREQIPIPGSRLDHYVTALREAAAKLESRGTPLYEALREVTHIYEAEETAEAEAPAVPVPQVATPTPEAPAPVEPVPAEPDAAAVDGSAGEPTALDEDDQALLEELDRMLHHACVAQPNEANRTEAIHHYLKIKHPLASRLGAFGLVNNRIFRSGESLAVPYMIGDSLVIHGVQDGRVEMLGRRLIGKGTLLTDRWISELAGRPGEVIDFEPLLFEFRDDEAERIEGSRIRDVAAAIQRVNSSVNRTQGVFALRCLAAKVAGISFKTFLNAKNMQPEVRDLNAELDRFLNGTLARRVPLLVRILMRNIGGLASKPTVIDRLWTDTIDIAEVHVRGSSIVNELRRSTHHALGDATLRLARAYQTYLETGDTSGLVVEGHAEPGPADEEARSRSTPLTITSRIVEDLEKLLGSGDVIERLQDWQEQYAATLVRCEFGKSLSEELEETVTSLRERNRFVYYHHLRILKAKAETFSGDLPEIRTCADALQTFLDRDPSDPSLNIDETEQALRDVVGRLEGEIRRVSQQELFARLERVLECHRSEALLDATEAVGELRRHLRQCTELVGFPVQRRYLYHLDCLLEETAYLALRRVASRYEEEGVQLQPCLRIIRTCARNLELDGVRSRELHDLTDMLVDRSRTYAEALNLLDGIQRCFHKMLQRVISPFEAMRERLGMGKQELQSVIGNLQRGLFDLNCMVQFTELTGRHIRDHVSNLNERLDGQPISNRKDEEDAFDIIHISHRGEIQRRVESEDPADCLRARYGGKGCSLLYISHLSLPTRDGFILPTALPRSGLHHGDRTRFERAVERHLRILEADIANRDGLHRCFGDENQPLLLAVRGGSVLSLPGLLSTVVFVGMNDTIAQTLAAEDPWHAYDSYRRFLASFAVAVWGVDIESYGLVEEMKTRYGVQAKDDVPWEGMKEVVQASKAVLRQRGHGKELDTFLEEPHRQVIAAVHAVFNSWEKNAACRYREIKRICDDWHTAAIVQEMAFGNRTNLEAPPDLDETTASLTGVVPHTRLTESGVRELEGEYKFSAAGDDLVSGVTGLGSFRAISELENLMPMLYRRLRHVVARLRRFQGTDQEVEFTVDRGVLSILQSRTSEKKTDTEATAFVDPGAESTQGIGVCGCAFRGVAAFDEADRDELTASGLEERDDVDGILMVMENPTPDDIPVILSADALLAAKGGATSHAAVAINGFQRKPLHAVMSAVGLRVDSRRHLAEIVDESGDVVHRIAKGDVVSLHGTTGEVYLGSRPIARSATSHPSSRHRHAPGPALDDVVQSSASPGSGSSPAS